MTTLHVMTADAENSNGTETKLFYTRHAAWQAGCEVIDGFRHADDWQKSAYKKKLDTEGFVEGFNNDWVLIRETEIEGSNNTVEPLVPDNRLKLPWTAQPYGPDEGTRFNIPQINIDIRMLYDGSGRRDIYPDGIVQTADEVVAIKNFILTAGNNFHDMVVAIQELTAALDSCTTQIEQMKGLFDDSDGNIEQALEDAMCAEQVAHVTLNKVKEGLK